LGQRGKKKKKKKRIKNIKPITGNGAGAAKEKKGRREKDLLEAWLLARVEKKGLRAGRRQSEEFLIPRLKSKEKGTGDNIYSGGKEKGGKEVGGKKGGRGHQENPYTGKPKKEKGEEKGKSQSAGLGGRVGGKKGSGRWEEKKCWLVPPSHRRRGPKNILFMP